MSKKCPKCSAENYDSASNCKYCGEPLKYDMYISADAGLATKNAQKSILDKSTKILVVIIVLIVIMIAVLVGVFVFSNSSSSENDSQPSAAVEDSEFNANRLSGDTDSLTTENLITGPNQLNAQEWDEYIAVDEVILDQENIELEEGDIVSLDAEVRPENASVKVIVWESSDSDIVYVDDYGTIKAIAEGTAYIYAYAYNENKYDVCQVTVTSKNKLIEPDRTADHGKYEVSVDTYLSLRYGPGTEYNEISRVKDGSVITVYAYDRDESGNTWAYVKYNGDFGWVYDNFLISQAQTTADTETETTEE